MFNLVLAIAIGTGLGFPWYLTMGMVFVAFIEAGVTAKDRVTMGKMLEEIYTDIGKLKRR